MSCNECDTEDLVPNIIAGFLFVATIFYFDIINFFAAFLLFFPSIAIFSFLGIFTVNDDGDASPIKIIGFPVVPLASLGIINTVIGIGNEGGGIFVYVASFIAYVGINIFLYLNRGVTVSPVVSNGAYKEDSTSRCAHDWVFSHKGVDKNWPRYHFKCRKCGQSEARDL